MCSNYKASLRRAWLERWTSPSPLTPFNRNNASRNPEAYDLYLRGLHAADRYDREGFEAAANHFPTGARPRPEFPRPRQRTWPDAHLSSGVWICPVVETYERARHSLETAIRLDPNSGVAHAWLGWVHTAYDWDWPAAAVEVNEALRFSPRDAIVLNCAARLSEALVTGTKRSASYIPRSRETRSIQGQTIFSPGFTRGREDWPEAEATGA